MKQTKVIKLIYDELSLYLGLKKNLSEITKKV